MTAEQLEELLERLQDEGDTDAIHELYALAPSLASRVISAEKLAGGLSRILDMGSNAGEKEADELDALIAAYREASK